VLRASLHVALRVMGLHNLFN